MRIVLPIAVAAALAGPAAAEPMWNVAGRWVCETVSHAKMQTDGTNVRVNEERNRQVYDFENGTVTTGFTDLGGDIGFTKYTESRWGGFNIVEVLWNGESYPIIITEKHGEWWYTGASGWADKDRTIWISNYRCQPD